MIKKLNKDKAICIPRAAVDYVGLKKGDRVYFYKEGEAIVATKHEPSTDVLLENYTHRVDRNGNINIGSKIREQASVCSEEYGIEWDRNKILVKAVK